MNYIMSCLIGAFTKCIINETTRKNRQPNKLEQKAIFMGKTPDLNLKAPRNKVKIQSDKNLNYIKLLFVTTKHVVLDPDETTRKNSDVKFRNP